MKVSCLLVNGLVAGALAVPTALSANHVVHEKRDASANWVKRDAVNSNTRIPVRIALKQRNLDNGMDYLMDVSDPSSSSYGKHYTPEQVVELFAPDDESISTVKSWLVASGIPAGSISVPKSKVWIQFDSTASQLESVLKTKYHVYNHARSTVEHIGTDEYTLPGDVSQLVDFITPGVAFAQRKGAGVEKRGNAHFRHQTKTVPSAILAQLKASPNVSDNCGSYITPQCIKDMYNITEGTLSDSSNRMGMFEIDGERYSQDDLDSFYSSFAPNIPAGTAPTAAFIDGATAPTSQANAGGESDLDFETAHPILYPQGTVLYETLVTKSDIFNTFLDAIDGAYCTSSAYGETGDDPTVDGTTRNEQCGAYKPANVISISYGESEADFPVNYQKRQCDEYMKLGLQGTSLFVASGDDGVARRTGPCLGPNQDIFTPDYPSGCPYLTTVGATTLSSGSSPGDQETATTEFSSGGGFSNIYTTPSYQKDAVSTYFSAHDPGYESYSTSDGTVPTDGGIYNKAGRGYPDLAAVGQNGVFIIQGKSVTSGGTSMAAPLVASIFNRINEERINAGKGPVGFVNPTIYAHPEAFNDIVEGDQSLGGPNGDSQPSECGNNGFSAVQGWDPVTGLGTPNYPALLDVFMSL